MPARPTRRHYPLEEYFVLAEMAPFKLEYFQGEILAMAGGSLAHNRISANVLGLLHAAFRGGACEAVGSDQRLETPAGLWTYPDVSVYCGEVVRTPLREDTATNPRVLFEVTSRSTRDYDHDEKLPMYREIPSLTEVVLIEQEIVRVEVHSRTAAGWTTQVYTSLEQTAALSMGVSLPLRDVYERVFAS